MRMRLLLLFLLSTFALAVNGQTIYSMDKEGSFEIFYKSYGNNSRYNSKIINQLALANRKVPDKTSFTFLYNFNTSISYNLENQLEATIVLTPSICTGDVFVYGFDLSKVLVPAFCNVSFRLMHPVEGEKWAATQQKVKLLDLEQGIIIGTFPDSLWAEGSRAEVKIVQFEFSEKTYAIAERELYLIRDYVAAAALADTLEARLKSARLRVHTPESAVQTLIFGAKSLLLLHEACAIRSIIIPGKDPMRLNEKFRASAFRYNDLLPYLQRNIITTSLTGNLYRKTGDAYARVLRDALSLSQKTDYYSSPFFYRLYTNCITTGQLLSIKNQLDQFIGNRLKEGWNTRHLSLSTDKAVLGLANQLMAEDRYAESVDILSSAIKMAKANPFVPVSDTINQRLAIARNGLTASYIRVVRKSINKNLSGLAENYLDEADRYSEKYQMSAFRLNELPPLYEQLADLYIRKGLSQLSSGDYALALSEFEQAKRIADNHEGVQMSLAYRKGVNEAAGMMFRQQADLISQLIVRGQLDQADNKLDEALAFASAYPVFRPDLTLTDSLRRSIAGLRYSSFLLAASELQKARQADGAMTRLLSATDLAKEFNLSHLVMYDTLITRIALPYINELYSKGRLKLWAGEPEQALHLVQEASQLGLRLNVAHYSVLQQQYSDLQQQAESLACSRIRGELTSLIGQAEDLLFNNHFDDAAQKIAEARELIFSKSYCGLSTTELNQRTAPFLNRVRWNTLHAEALELIGSGGLNEGIEKLQQAEVLFNTFRLDTVGLINTGLLALSMDSDNRELIDYTIGYLMARNRFDDALSLVEKLRMSKVSASETVNFQQSLARGLANRDKSELGEVPLKTMIKFYTSGDKWYKTFIDGYSFHIKSTL
jgi:tetratricopeptide (TPR) repeat protein